MEFTDDWMIGNDARILDEMAISKRTKVDRSTLKKIGGALLVYAFTMTLMALFL
ncbi:MAG: hypothetical protein U9N35_06735 [Euryarchaeota archaeon]|nr:hypothetical protein [Euryarchaeota archaeon]